MKKYVVRKNEIGTYVETLINEYYKFMENPKYTGKEAYEYLKGLRTQIAETRKMLKREGK